MARVLMVGVDPELVDFSDPALPPGMNAEAIRQGIAVGLAALQAGGHDAAHIYISSQATEAADGLSQRLASDPVDCVVIGGGVRLPPPSLILFEAVVNAVAQCSPTPAIALIALPPQALEAANRVLA